MITNHILRSRKLIRNQIKINGVVRTKAQSVKRFDGLFKRATPKIWLIIFPRSPTVDYFLSISARTNEAVEIRLFQLNPHAKQ